MRLMQLKSIIKGIWKARAPSSFYSGFYKFSTKCIKSIAQKKQMAKILENLGKFWALLLKKQALQIKKIGVVLLIHNNNFWGNWPKKYGLKVVGKGFFNSWVYGAATSAATIQKNVQIIWNSIWAMQKGMCRMLKKYKALNYIFSNLMIPTLRNILKFFRPHTYWLSPTSLFAFL